MAIAADSSRTFLTFSACRTPELTVIYRPLQLQSLIMDFVTMRTMLIYECGICIGFLVILTQCALSVTQAATFSPAVLHMSASDILFPGAFSQPRCRFNISQCTYTERVVFNWSPLNLFQTPRGAETNRRQRGTNQTVQSSMITNNGRWKDVIFTEFMLLLLS